MNSMMLQKVTTRRPPTNSIPLYKKVPKLAHPETDPLAALLMQLSAQRDPLPNKQPKQALPLKTDLAGLTSLPAFDPFEAMFGRSGSIGGTGASALLGALGGGALGGGGGGADMSALLAALGGGGGTPSLGGSSQGLLDVRNIGGNLRAASLLGETPGPEFARTVDMTSLFNLQGRASGSAGLAGLSGINMARLQELDRQGVIDLSDLSPAGAMAASRHFQG